MKQWSSMSRAAVRASALALAMAPLAVERAQAFGGVFSTSASVRQSALRVVFIDEPGPAITAVVALDYAGDAEALAWLVPVRSKPGEVSVSSNVLIDRLDGATAPRYWASVKVAGMCMGALAPQDSYVDGGLVAPDENAPPPPVRVSERGTAGSYEWTHIAADRSAADPAAALTAWLTTNGFSVDSKVLAPYAKDGYGFLALRLMAGAERGTVRPLAFTYEGEPVVPIRAAASSAQDDLALSVWLFGPSQAVPENYPSLVLNDALIEWSSARKFTASVLPAGGAGPFGPRLPLPNGYDALVAAAVDEAGGRGFVTELAGPASQYRERVWSALDEENFNTLTSTEYEDGFDALYAASVLYAGWDGFQEAVTAALTLPDGVDFEQFAIDPEQHRGSARIDVQLLFRGLEQKVVRPVSELAARFVRAPYLTRLYGRFDAADLTVDPRFVYNFDLDQLSNVHVARQYATCRPELARPEDAPWRIELPQGGSVVGEAGSWPLSLGALPANLKVVTLGTSGSGIVVQDNSESIGMKLFANAGLPDQATTVPAMPQHGSRIGGTQSVRPPPASAGEAGDRPSEAAADGCALASDARSDGTLLGGFIMLMAWKGLRRRRGRSSSRAVQAERAVVDRGHREGAEP
jgi:hypothetical protein